MREIKISVPQGRGQEIARLAASSGASHVIVSQGRDGQTGQEMDEVRIKTSTPTGHRIYSQIRRSPLFQSGQLTFSSHGVKSIVSTDDIRQLTRPFCMPLSDVYEDLWQNTHVTASFFIRAAASACLMTYGILQMKIVLTLGGMFFTVFSPTLMATGMGIAMKDKRMIGHALWAFFFATAVSIAAAVAVTAVVHGPLLWDEFGSLKSNLFIAIAAALAGAIADADDTGRRQLIAVAAAFPFARFPPWIGACLVLGFPDRHATLHRLAILIVNVLSMIVVAAASYGWLKHRDRDV